MTMTEITPELKALADALADVLAEHDRNTCIHENIKRGGAIWTICEDCDRKWADDQGGFKPYADPPKIDAARKQLSAYRATQAKECRPPDGAKDESLWWLTREGDEKTVGMWQIYSGGKVGWDLFWGVHDAKELADLGWTVHSECRFGETGVVATAVGGKSIDFSSWSLNTLPERTGNAGWQPDLQDLIYTAINHVEGDYDDADENAAEQVIERLVLAIKELLRTPKLKISDEEIREIITDNVSELALMNVGWFFFDKVARAVIAKVGGEK